jgi:hypothetical protein
MLLRCVASIAVSALAAVSGMFLKGNRNQRQKPRNDRWTFSELGNWPRCTNAE